MLRLAGCVLDGIMRSIPQCCLEQSAWRPDPTGLAAPAAYKIQLEKAALTGRQSAAGYGAGLVALPCSTGCASYLPCGLSVLEADVATAGAGF